MDEKRPEKNPNELSVSPEDAARMVTRLAPGILKGWKAVSNKGWKPATLGEVTYSEVNGVTVSTPPSPPGDEPDVPFVVGG